jgi:hypothetical protein
MIRKRFTPEQIITMRHEAEVLLSQGAQVSEVWRKLVYLNRPITVGGKSTGGTGPPAK